MGKMIQITTQNHQPINGYLAEPAEPSKGGIVVIQEIFGVTPHIQSVADRLANAGYAAIAPSFFDHIEANIQLDYDQTGLERGKALASQVDIQQAIDDMKAAAERVSSTGHVGTVGFCWGGTMALLAAQNLALPSVSYYGGRNTHYLDKPLTAPVMFHFGDKDPSIPQKAIEQHKASYPDMSVFTYSEAGHAFNRDVEGDPHYYPESAKLAWEHTLAFFDKNVG